MQKKLNTKTILVAYLVLEILVISEKFVQGSSDEEDPVVQTCQGKVRGYIDTARCKRPFYAFKGIPYAKPPVGEFRFKAPVSPEPWKDVLDATKDGAMCIQKNYLVSEHPPVEGEEDCLFINVYTPKLPTSNAARVQKKKSQLPVMVFIHYGAFFAGTGNSDYLGPEYFMDKNVVLVTFNYRLGVFGFLSTNDDASPGNWALKDQVAALKWVQDNISAFGGNNKKVTIFGQSAGAGSVHYHMLSPTTRSLFQSAISQSGSTLSLWARPRNELQAQVAKQQAVFVGCDATANTHDMVECLRRVDAKTLAESASLFKEVDSSTKVGDITILTTSATVVDLVRFANSTKVYRSFSAHIVKCMKVKESIGEDAPLPITIWVWGFRGTAVYEETSTIGSSQSANSTVSRRFVNIFFSAEPFIIYGPVTEKITQANPQPYITDDPLNLIKSGKFHRVPWIIGVVSDEGILRAAPLLRQPKIQSQLNEKFNEFLPQMLGIPFSAPPEEVPNIWKKITNYFLMTDHVNVTKPESVQGFIDLYGDRSFNYGSYQSALLHAWKGHSPIWFYHFAYKGAYTYGDHFASTDEKIKFKWGVSHCDDLLYLFTSKRLFEPLNSKADILMSQIMVQLWTNFAKYGNPTPTNEIIAPKWEPLPNLEGSSSVKNTDLIYLNITGPYKSDEDSTVKLEVRSDFYPERMMFWESLPLEENINGIE